MRVARALPAAVAGALLVAGTAAAGTVERSGDTVRFLAAPGELNDVDVNDEGGYVVVTDFANPITAGPGCQARFFTQAVCDRAGVVRVSVALGDGADSRSRGTGAPFTALPVAVDGGDGNDVLHGGPRTAVELLGGPGDDDLVGGAADDALSGGPGDDNLNGADGDDSLAGEAGDDRLEAGRGDDRVDAGPGEDDIDADRGNDVVDVTDGQAEHDLLCGVGEDRLLADPSDPVVLDCDAFDAGTFRVRASVPLHLSCPDGCAEGRVRLSAAGRTIGSASLAAARAGAAVRRARSVRLHRRGRRMLSRRGRLAVQVRARARTNAGELLNAKGRLVLRRRR